MFPTRNSVFRITPFRYSNYCQIGIALSSTCCINTTRVKCITLAISPRLSVCKMKIPRSGCTDSKCQRTSWAGGQLWRLTYLRHTNWPPTAVSSVLTTWPWATHQTQIGSSRVVPHAGRNSESMLDKNDSHWACWHLTLAYKYIYCMVETWEHVWLHW